MVLSSMEKRAKEKTLRGGCYDNKKRKIHESSTNGGSGHIIIDVIRFTKSIYHSSGWPIGNRISSLFRR